MDHLLHAASFLTSSSAAVFITQYDPSSHSDTSSEASLSGLPHDVSPVHSSGFQHHDDDVVFTSSTSNHPLLASNIFKTPPSPTLFITALSIYVLCTLYTHHLHRRHRFQNHFLILGICIGVLIASADTVASATTILFLGGSPTTTRPPLMAASLRIYLPWTVLAASASSAVVHFAAGGMIADEEETEEEEEEKEGKVEEKVDREFGDVVGGAVWKI